MKTVLPVLLYGALLPRFYPDDPIVVDNDRLPIAKPEPIELSATYDLLENTFAQDPPARPIPRAMNINTIGEVPDSSWFTNRIGVREMSIEELSRGPDIGGPPDTARPILIISAKRSGITPGFTVRDARGNVYFLKFDPREHPNLSTGADVISKNFFHAIGYNVPEAYIVYLDAELLEIDPSATIALPGGKTAPMDRVYLRFMLENAARGPDGNVRAVASLLVPGKVLGPFEFHGTRPDDPNDIFPHEHRRELRGYRVFASWLNHDDCRAINTLDTFITSREDRGYLRHYLIDFGSTLGSGSDYLQRIAPQDPRGGNEYLIDLESVWKAAYTFGFWDRAWRNVEYPYPLYAEIGRIEADFFEPQRWKPEYPNRAFDHMLADDAFWAAKIVARFTDSAIRGIVKTGDYLSKEAETYLADTLIRRRDKVVSYYFRRLNPLDAFRVEGLELVFTNLGEESGLAAVEGYEYEWFVFDNESGARDPVGSKGETRSARIAIPESAADYLMARIHTRSAGQPLWGLAVDVYIRNGAVIGIDREISE
ncbi:MAG TPA: hypothetical protein VLK65_26325 [Vicinamibacteria bacterium]|nr:hypothetical protein [Vicinamibacteria bacterium]